jgi:hypothetical protein
MWGSNRLSGLGRPSWHPGEGAGIPPPGPKRSRQLIESKSSHKLWNFPRRGAGCGGLGMKAIASLVVACTVTPFGPKTKPSTD